MAKSKRHRQEIKPPEQFSWKEHALLWLEIFGHGMFLIVFISLLTGRAYSWITLAVYAAIQLAVMAADKFRNWKAWPFILRVWRTSRSRTRS